jgi:signal transduction histidine kinase
VVQRETNLFKQSMELRAYLLGRVLASSAADLWRSGGRERVNRLIEDANGSEDLVSVRWVKLDARPGDPDEPRLPVAEFPELESGREVLLFGRGGQGGDFFYAYFPVVVDGVHTTALELSQPLAPMRRYIRSTVMRKLVLFLSFVVIGGAIVWWLGSVMVARPVQSMVEQARHVGEEDLTVRTHLRARRDELALLAQGLNRMVEHLQESRQRLQEETARRIETLEQLHHAERLATVGKLASGLAHELGTPLNVVSGRAKMIATEEMNRAEVVESATIIGDQSERMTRIIRQLLDFARARTPQKTKADLREIVDGAAAMLKPIATQRGIVIRRAPDTRAVLVDVDQGQIQQVLSNILVNAIHAMPDGGDVTIAVAYERAVPPAERHAAEGEYAAVRITDQGVGIRSEDVPRIFTPFFSTKAVGEGTGLGLSIAHGIVTEHGGWLAVESEVGKGSAFTMYLPPDRTA